jgi:hypothetical protein
MMNNQKTFVAITLVVLSFSLAALALSQGAEAVIRRGGGNGFGTSGTNGGTSSSGSPVSPP